MGQVRRAQRLSQGDTAAHLGVTLATVRKWEDGLALPDRSLWEKLEEAMGMPVPDPRVPIYSTAERELIDTVLLLTDEIRSLRVQLETLFPSNTRRIVSTTEPKVIDIESAAAYSGLSVRLIRRLVAERRIAFHKLGGRVMFATTDLDAFIERARREEGSGGSPLLRGRSGVSPRRRST
jgi:excisionase family DNA binding protein